jgi:iron complex outermembrane receptor protein
MRIDRRWLVSASLLAGTLLTAPAATASPESAVNAPDEDDPAGQSQSDTITITGERADQGQNAQSSSGALGNKSLLDTPYSITVVDAEDIVRRQPTTVGQIFINDPSISSPASAGTVNWWGTQIRGMGVQNYYIDGVPLLLYWGGDYPLEAVQSVEALKGLTGFMYGFGTPGGVISYRSKRPTADTLLTTSLTYRNSSVLHGAIDSGGPLTADGRLRYRANVAGEKGTAYNGAGVNRWLAALALEYDVSPALRWHARATYEYSNLKHEPFQIYWRQYPGTRLPRPTYDYDNLNIANSFYRTRTLTTATGLDWSFAENWSAKLDYGYARKLHHSNKMFAYMKNEAGDYAGYVFNFAELDQSHFAQLMVQGEFTTGPVRHEIVAGLAYQKGSADYGAGNRWSNDFNGNIYRPQPFRTTGPIDFGTDGGPSEDNQRSAFISDTLHFGSHLQAILGVRYTRFKIPDVDGNPAVDSSYRTSAATPTFALIYKPAPYVSLYGSYAESLEGGGRVGGEYANFGEIMKPTLSRQYEIGAKYEHEALSFAAAAFRVERAAQIDQIINGQRYLTQGGLTLYKGFEASVRYRVAANLRLGAGMLHLNPRISKVSEGNEALLGNIAAQAARWQWLANAEYDVPGIAGLSLHGNVRRFGEAPADDKNILYIPGRTVGNIGFQYVTAIGGQQVAFTGNLNNVANARYWTVSGVGEARNGSLGVSIRW